jgi:predicted nucleic-acid-binding Zn-ribbon protein
MRKRCPKCGHNKLDLGTIKVGKVFKSISIGYRSDMHHPYADHVSGHKVTVCMNCGYAELFFDVDDLKRKLSK